MTLHYITRDLLLDKIKPAEKDQGGYLGAQVVSPTSDISWRVLNSIIYLQHKQFYKQVSITQAIRVYYELKSQWL